MYSHIHMLSRMLEYKMLHGCSIAYFDSDGEEIPADSSQYIWQGNMFYGTGVASEAHQCTVHFLLSADVLTSLSPLM